MENTWGVWTWLETHGGKETSKFVIPVARSSPETVEGFTEFPHVTGVSLEAALGGADDIHFLLRQVCLNKKQ